MRVKANQSLLWGKIMKWTEWHALADDEGFWAEHQERGLLKAEHVEGFILRLWFEEELDVS